LSSADLTEMRATRQEIIGDNSTPIAIRRGDTTLAAQTVRLVFSGGGESESEGFERGVAGVRVFGDTTLDIQRGDRFTVADNLYTVTAVTPNMAGVCSRPSSLRQSATGSGRKTICAETHPGPTGRAMRAAA